MKQRLEDRIMERLYPKLKEIETRLTNKVTRRVMATVNEHIYPPENMLKKDFIRKVKESDKRIKEGRSLTFKNVKELKKHLESLK
ncbi:MAG: hypothetical protein HYW24_04450 [Candidatus Aenigmarchaeota archaeon]|nr:hypothetical protein [Candidatus Aenigmarchaeota archaeon]